MASGATSDLDDVRGKLVQLAAEGRVEELIELVITLLFDARQSNTALQSRLQNALRALYGRKSEKFSADQLSLLFAGLGDEAPEAARTIVETTGDVPQPEEPPPAPRGKRGRKPFPSELSREVKNIPVADASRTCARCGGAKTTTGFVPATSSNSSQRTSRSSRSGARRSNAKRAATASWSRTRRR